MLFHFISEQSTLDSGTSCDEGGRYENNPNIKKLKDIFGPNKCQQKCRNHENCMFWYLNKEVNACYLLEKDDAPSTPCSPGKCVRGPKICPQGIYLYIKIRVIFFLLVVTCQNQNCKLCLESVFQLNGH